MYMKRKIDDWLVNWKRKKEKSPALVVGIRQCGKTESIENFGKTTTKKSSESISGTIRNTPAISMEN